LTVLLVLIFFMHRLESHIKKFTTSKNGRMRVDGNEDEMRQVGLKINRFKKAFISVFLQNIPITFYFPIATIVMGINFPYKSRTSSLLTYFLWVLAVIAMHVTEIIEVYSRYKNKGSSSDKRTSAGIETSNYVMTTSRSEMASNKNNDPHDYSI